MPAEAVLVTVAVLAFFAVFAFTLAWGLNRAGGPKAK
jgi:hypothetical protein